MKNLNFRRFEVTISGTNGEYGYVAKNDRHKMAQPNPGYSDETFSTMKEAEEGAKEAIFIYEVAYMFSQLPAVEQAFIAYITTRIYEGDWVVDSKTDIIQKVLKAGGIRRKA